MYDPTETDDTHEQNRISPPIIANPQRLLMSDADTESTADDGYDDGNRTAQSVTPITGNTPTTSHTEIILNPSGDQLGMNTSPIQMFKRPRETEHKDNEQNMQNSQNHRFSQNNAKNEASTSRVSENRDNMIPRFSQKCFPKSKNSSKQTNQNPKNMKNVDNPELWSKPEFELRGPVLVKNVWYNVDLKRQKTYLRFDDAVLKFDLVASPAVTSLLL